MYCNSCKFDDQNNDKKIREIILSSSVASFVNEDNTNTPLQLFGCPKCKAVMFIPKEQS